MNADLNNVEVSCVIVLINSHTLCQYNASSYFNDMDGDVENGDVSGGHFFMNSHNISESDNQNFIYTKNKRDCNILNVPLMGKTVLQDGAEITNMLYAPTLHQHANMEYNNVSHSPWIIGKIPPSKSSSVSTLTSISSNSINNEVFYSQNPIHKNIKYSYLSKNQARAVHHASDVIQKQIKLLDKT